MSIDPSALEPYRDAMGDGADDFIIDLINTFLDSTQEHIDALYTALSQEDAKSFMRAAHTLKSNSAIFGAQVLAGMCLELETAGKKAELTGLQPKLDQLKTEYQQVCQELSQLRTSLAS